MWPDSYGEENIEITYNTSDKASWMKMSNCLHDFLKRKYFLTHTQHCPTSQTHQNVSVHLCPSAYNDTMQNQCNNYNCTKGAYFIQSTFSAPHHTKWACPFTQSMLGACSGLDDPTFGYNCSMPCVIIKMNRVCLIVKYAS